MVHINVSTYLHIDQTEHDDGKTIPYYWKERKQKMCSWSQTLKEDRVHLDKYKEVIIMQNFCVDSLWCSIDPIPPPKEDKRQRDDNKIYDNWVRKLLEHFKIWKQ